MSGLVFRHDFNTQLTTLAVAVLSRDSSSSRSSIQPFNSSICPRHNVNKPPWRIYALQSSTHSHHYLNLMLLYLFTVAFLISSLCYIIYFAWGTWNGSKCIITLQKYPYYDTVILHSWRFAPTVILSHMNNWRYRVWFFFFFFKASFTISFLK